MVKLPPMNMALFQQELNSIDEDYPLSIPPSTILTVQIIMGVILLIALLIAIWQVCKRKMNLWTLLKVALEIKDLVMNNSGGLVNSLKSLLSNSSNLLTDVEAPTQEVSTATVTPSTSNISSMVPKLPLQNQVPLLMLASPANSLTPDIVEKLFQVYQHLPAHDSHHYKKYLQWWSPIPMDTLEDRPSITS